jgi:DNA-binding NtrC family response regulator
MTKQAMNILVVEDDEALRDALLITLETAGYRASGAEGGPQALALIERQPFQMVVSDLRMAPMDGLTLLTEIRSRKPGLPVLLMTAFGDVDKAVAAMKGGACDFMLKPFEPKTLIEQIERYALPPQAEGVVAADAKTREVLLLAARVARTDATVLLTGESGTGKEVFARYIHDQSSRAKGPFVAINCAAIPDNLLEATLFGYEKGAFTGAQTAQAGKFEQADHGTLLLDEISEMDVRLQAKLLRAIQERVIDRVGGGRPVPVDIRIIATSNRNLAEAVREGSFREDLLFRLNVVNLKIPALRERPADIGELADYFVRKYAQANQLPARPLSADAKRALGLHRWPGNVRELENTLHRAVLLSNGPEIGIEGILTADGTRLDQARGPDIAAQAALAAEQVTRNLVGRTVAEVERDLILETLKHCLGNRTHAANILGISIRTLRNKLNEYAGDGLPVPPPHGGSEMRGAA